MEVPIALGLAVDRASVRVSLRVQSVTVVIGHVRLATRFADTTWHDTGLCLILASMWLCILRFEYSLEQSSAFFQVVFMGAAIVIRRK